MIIVASVRHKMANFLASMLSHWIGILCALFLIPWNWLVYFLRLIRLFIRKLMQIDWVYVLFNPHIAQQNYHCVDYRKSRTEIITFRGIMRAKIVYRFDYLLFPCEFIFFGCRKSSCCFAIFRLVCHFCLSFTCELKLTNC